MTGTATPLKELFDNAGVRVSDEALQNLENKKSALDNVFAGGDDSLARYKIEVMFGPKHTVRGATSGFVTLWENGSRFQGGGDGKLYICDSADQTQKRGCGKYITDKTNAGGAAVCQHCGMVWKPEHLVGEIYYMLPLEKWAEVLTRWFHILDNRADIRIKHARLSMRDAQEQEMHKKLRGELVSKVRSFDQRSTAVYPLQNIIKDTAAGADLTKRILAFLRA